MAIVTWYTNPGEDKHPSFYYYNNSTRDMVRIRMELDREDEGNPKVMAMKNRYVGFGSQDKIDDCSSDVADWCVNSSGQIYFQENDDDERIVFSANSQAGLYVVDFTLDDPSDDRVHFGNVVTNHPVLPRCTTAPAIDITESILIAVAQKHIGEDEDTKICDFDDNTCTLVRALEAMSHDEEAE